MTWGQSPGLVPDTLIGPATLSFANRAVSVLIVNPNRPGRDQSRVIKRRKDRYTTMTNPRHEYHDKVLDEESLTS